MIQILGYWYSSELFLYQNVKGPANLPFSNPVCSEGQFSFSKGIKLAAIYEVIGNPAFPRVVSK